MSRGWILLLLGALVGLGNHGLANAEDSPSLDGVWLIQRAPRELRTIDGKEPPLLPQARAQYDAQRALRRKGDTSFDPTTWCASAGVPRLMVEPYKFEIMVNRRQVAFLYEWNRWARLVDMTGNDIQPIYPLTFGTANGKFEGDTLVIVSRQLASTTFIDRSGLPHSDDMILTERLRLLGPNVLENRMRIEDPATYAEPWETVVTYRRQPDAGIEEDVCLDRIKQGKPAI
jgi:hypothetical protein